MVKGPLGKYSPRSPDKFYNVKEENLSILRLKGQNWDEIKGKWKWFFGCCCSKSILPMDWFLQLCQLCTIIIFWNWMLCLCHKFQGSMHWRILKFSRIYLSLTSNTLSNRTLLCCYSISKLPPRNLLWWHITTEVRQGKVVIII